ncbi:NACHT domain-containing protein [Microcoleus sp. A003_D6]|uniref:NACHT C-terminal alpha/beta 1 domain-containing protein n=1 Tax=Microcoleus sp. A003_D6 TaxID=3055266 RepID=UPI002FD4C438
MGKPTGLGKLAQATMNFTQKVAMARKYGKNATTKNNVFKLVEALLALADGEIDVPGDKLKATFNVEWVKENELLVSGKFQQKRNKQTKIVEGITKEDLWALVECFGKALELSQPKDEKNVDNAQRRGEAIQDVLDCLKDLGILVLESSARNQGFWKFSLKLHHQTKPKKNLEVIEKQWQDKIGSVTVEISHETPKPKEEPINWQEICRQNLAQQQQLTTNPFTNAGGMTPQLDGVYVPLAIVERQKPKPQPGNQEEKEKEVEKLIPLTEERFFEDVLRQGKSDISQGRKIAIIGEPGAGKTTRLQKIADWILEQELGLPIWIDLAELGEQDICQFLENVWLRRCQGEVTRRDLEAQMSRVWLLLDGVDEMTHTQGMQQLAKDLLRSWVQAARVVVTCRVNVWEADKNAFSGFDVFRNLEFNSEQVREYIRRWFAGMGDAAAGESLEAELVKSENSRLKELIQNPLRLWMLCQIWQTGGGLPETQAGLYAQFVDWVYRWKADEEILDQREGIDEALARLALAAMEQKDEVSRFRLRESWVLKVLGSRPIFQAVMKLGWLNRVERFPEAICVFYHATFQEYFAALAVDDWDYFLPRNHVNFPVAGKEYRIFEPQWKQVILLWLGLEDVNRKQKEGFIKGLVGFEDGCGEFYKLSCSSLANSLLSQKLNDNNFLKNLCDGDSLNEDDQYIVDIPYHLAHAEMREQLYEIVTDVDFISFYQSYKLNKDWLWLDDLTFILSKGLFSYRYLYLLEISIKNKFLIMKCLFFRKTSQHDCLANVSVSTIRLQLIHNANILCWIIFCLKDLFCLYQNKEIKNANIFSFDNASDIVIRHCAQILPYPDFYRAWHGLTETQTSPLVQTLNLPQLLQTQLTETNLDQSSQLFCIDTSKFIDSHNPTPDIYEQFLDQNCPERPNGEPETLSQLKSYWNRLRRDSDKHPILIFYQDPTSPAAQGCSPTFLEALTRFDGTICLIADTPHPPLQTFSPHDPDLLQAVANWVKRVHFES